MRNSRFLFILLFFIPVNIYSQIRIKDSDNAVKIALQNSNESFYQEIKILSDMKIAKYSIRDFLPTLDFSFANNQSVTENGSDNKSKTMVFSATQLIFDGGQRKLKYDLNNISSLYTLKEFEQTKQTFSYEIQNQYYSLLKQIEIVKIKNELVENAAKQLEIIEIEKNLGLTLETDYLEYLISYLETENDRDTCQRDLERQKDTFKVALGLNKNVEIEFEEDFSIDNDYFELQDYANFLFERAKSSNLELKKQLLSMSATQKQINYSKQWFLPSITVEGSISFSGKNYPLTEPGYSIKLGFSFANNPLFPTEYGKTIGVKKNKINSIGDNATIKLFPSSTFILEGKQAEISLMQAKLNYNSSQNQLYEELLDDIYNHDDYLHTAKMKERSIALQEKRILVSEIELKNGNMKMIDYLQQLIKLSSSKIELLDYKLKTQMIERKIEVITEIPFGEIKNVCQAL